MRCTQINRISTKKSAIQQFDSPYKSYDDDMSSLNIIGLVTIDDMSSLNIIRLVTIDEHYRTCNYRRYEQSEHYTTCNYRRTL